MYHREILVSEYRNARQEQHEGTVPSLYGFVKQDKCVAEYDQWHGLRIINATHVILCGRGLEMDENRCVGAAWRLTLTLLWEVSMSLRICTVCHFSIYGHVHMYVYFLWSTCNNVLNYLNIEFRCKMYILQP